MSTYEYMMGFGSNGEGIELGPGVPVPPDAPPISVGNELNDFIAKLKAEKGPFVYIGKDSPEGKKFITWLSMYDPGFFEWIMKLALVKISAAALEVSEGVQNIPSWVMGNTIQFRKSLYDIYLASSSRVRRIIAHQGKILSTSITQIEFESFMKWWRSFDLPGVAALFAMHMANGEVDPKVKPVELPKKLFEFWKTTKGQVEPPKPLLGFGTSWLDWALDNWLWLVGGTIGGVFAGRYITRYREEGAAKRLEENPRTREGWGIEVKTKDGVFKLHPLIPQTHYRRLRAESMRTANKFRVSEGGKNLGVLYRSHGKRKWKAVSHHDVEKFSNSRAVLLRWLKEEATVQTMESQLEGMSLPMPVMMTNLTGKQL